MRFSYTTFGFLLIFITVQSCEERPNSEERATLFSLHTPEATGIHFSNELYETTDLNIITFEYMYNGAGVAVGDINGDERPDLYFAGNMTEGKLYLNEGNFRFRDITAEAGISTRDKWGTGVSMVDINADGRLDLYLCFAGPYGPERRRNQLYINQGDLTFTEAAAEYGLDDDAHTTHAAFLDHDRDGDLDVYLLNNITDETGPNIIRPKRVRGEMANTDRLYRNDGGRFTDVSTEAGILKEGYGLGVAVGDINQDGWPDIYVSNDYLSNDLLYINNQDGTFTDRAEASFRHSSYSSMGCDLGDYNNDGRPDIVALDMLPPDQKRRKLMMASINYNRFLSEIRTGYFPQYMRNTLQLHQGEGPHGETVFAELGQLAGIHATDWSWSPLLEDVDNDGWKDLLITNGYPRDITNMDFVAYKANLMMGGQYNERIMAALTQAANELEGAYLPNFVFQNQGDHTFVDRSAEWGFTQNSFSHGAAVADLDGDGDLDYVTNNSYDKVFVYENHARQREGRHYLRLRLEGPGNNPQGLGAKVWLYQDGDLQFREHFPFRGYQSTVEPVLHFGLGRRERVDSLVVVWPDGARQLLREPRADQQLTVVYDPRPATRRTPPAGRRLFASQAGVAFRHEEPHYNDFDVQPLLPHKHSQDGPSLATGDVNGDGRTDFFVGGAFRQSGRLFLRQPDGGFIGQPLDEGDAFTEDLGSLFFDADQDGDLDLYVTSGSSEFPDTSAYYQDRLYQNDGRGGFELDESALPTMRTSTSCARAADFDQDGDLDLFVGGRVSPGRYPEPPRSYLLENREGRFVDVTAQRAPALMRVGLVTDAQWADVDGDGWSDLLLSGEWMPITYFRNEAGKLVNQTEAAGLQATTGWWNRLRVHDLDGDGDLDLVAGNLGWNTPYRTSAERPLSLFVGDFDDNGLPDPILVQHLLDRQVPVANRNDLLQWIVPLKRRFTSYESYATTNWPELFPEQAARELRAELLASAWFENLGRGRFIVHILPLAAQLAPIYGILPGDFNGDGRADLLLTGNTSAPDPQVGRYDAFNGLLLLGTEAGGFLPRPFQQSGFFVPGEGRDLALVTLADGQVMVLATQNNGPLLSFILGGQGHEH